MELTTFSLDIANKSLHEEGFVNLSNLKVGEHVIRSIVEWFFGDKGCVLAHCLRYGAFLSYIESFLSGRDAGRRALMVHLLAEGSRVDYYAKSHLHVFSTEKGARVVLDARLSREISGGYVITVIFIIKDLSKNIRLNFTFEGSAEGINSDSRIKRRIKHTL
ncbi:hypothetical protein QBC46DRAFT_462801 [Diplogelasinospora grovesii]|uniref:Uncharacterized protein n=1 Tax=Diplogelasinospora grovesii TaxID=303347 RepID=A0AAN6RZE1_9PEZI|nr:hypothetical protein QBC46DRAFT_462801 [Diplogelasinospora grovesii]